MTARAVPHPHYATPHRSETDSEPPSSTEMALEPLNESIETVHTGELILESLTSIGSEDDERTPITGVSPWQRLVPPPLPGSD